MTRNLGSRSGPHRQPNPCYSPAGEGPQPPSALPEPALVQTAEPTVLAVLTTVVCAAFPKDWNEKMFSLKFFILILILKIKISFQKRYEKLAYILSEFSKLSKKNIILLKNIILVKYSSNDFHKLFKTLCVHLLTARFSFPEGLYSRNVWLSNF